MCEGETADVRDSVLHSTLEAFTADAAGQLAAETASGAEIPFEIVGTEGRPGQVPLYCYRSLTEQFIDERLGLLSALPTYAPAARALAGFDRVAAYLGQRGEPRLPGEPRERADAALRSFLRAVFAERSQFGFDPVRFELAYGELERALYDGQSVTVVIAPLLGIALDHSTRELALGEGLSLIRGDALDEAPAEAVWGDTGEPHVLAMLTIALEPSRQPPVSLARARFRRLLTALRLFERGGYALGPLAWTRADTGPWRPIPFGGSGRPRLLTMIGSAQEDELRAFCSLIARRSPSSGELAWALARFEMGCERLAPFEALTDYLLALRALLEPEGPSSGRLSARLAAICARPEERGAFAERTARAIALEHAVITGLGAHQPGDDALVDELCEHLRALLRDALCGHLQPNLVTLADELLADAVTAG
ncbi:MAG TPA: hypothetical protein VMP89_12600 [Solirubrobacteraceae bacterium]|nr:hypothetical protein [Solirubrobacteraceae bacterium]